jgi:hypothetical protein
LAVELTDCSSMIIFRRSWQSVVVRAGLGLA